MIKLGMPILFEYDNLEDNFKLAKKLNLDFVELNLNFPYCMKCLERGGVKELLNKYHLEATLHFFDEADFGSYDEVVSAYLLLLDRYVSYGKDFIKMVNIHNNPGPFVTISGVKNYIYEKDYDNYIIRLKNNLNKVRSLLDSYGIKLVIENVDTGENAKFLIKNFSVLNKDGFHFNLDIGHDNINNNEFYRLLLKESMKLDEMHIHDGNEKKCHLSLGKGSINIKPYKDLAIKNNAYVVIEVKSAEDLINSIPIFKSL